MARASLGAGKVPHAAEKLTSKCHLLPIAPELRDAILECLLVSSEPLLYNSTGGSHYFLVASGIHHAVSSLVCYPDIILGRTPLAIAGTCKQLFWESVTIYYGKNAFVFEDMSCCKKSSIVNVPIHCLSLGSKY